MLFDIENAAKEVLVESYILMLDHIGQEFIHCLNRKAKQGVDIKLHLDAVGSRYFLNGKKLRKLLEPAVQLKWFHRFSWKRPLRFNIRNHRKLLIIDGCITFIGGFNIHDQSSLIQYGERHWRDTHLKIEGRIGQKFQRYFNDLWFRQRQKYLGGINNIDLIPNLSFHCRYLLRCKLQTRINLSKTSIYCSTPYFIPDEFIIKALISAAKRGVDVRLLVPNESDHILVNSLANKYYARLIEFGIKVYAYLPRMLHAKTIIIDSKSVMIGSANLDYRSLFINHELVCLLDHDKLAHLMTNAFRKDCSQSRIVTLNKPVRVKWWWLWRPFAALLKHWI